MTFPEEAHPYRRLQLAGGWAVWEEPVTGPQGEAAAKPATPATPATGRTPKADEKAKAADEAAKKEEDNAAPGEPK